MKRLNSSLVLLLCAFLLMSCNSEKNELHLTESFIDNNLRDAVLQLKFLESQIKDSIIPTTYQNGKNVNWGSSWWTSGFYTGSLLYLYEYTEDPELWEIIENKLAVLEKEKDNTTTHDLGFMLYNSFGNALRIRQDEESYKPILIKGAESLASRFNEKTQTIRSWDVGKNWDGEPWTYPVIIDNMMNLEFLTQVGKMTKNKDLIDIAIAHADATLKNHFRENFSSYHVVDYNPEDGSIIAKKTAQGAFDESSWARGQAWALYGYTMMYRETDKSEYLELAQGIADFYLNHPNLPEDLIPYWDMDQNRVNRDYKYYHQNKLRDVSTASVIASALLELSLYTKGGHGQQYIDQAERMLQSLSKPPYKAGLSTNGGFILKHSVGSIPHQTEVDVPLTYADYYYIEALIRYLRMLNGEEVIQ